MYEAIKDGHHCSLARHKVYVVAACSSAPLAELTLTIELPVDVFFFSNPIGSSFSRPRTISPFSLLAVSTVRSISNSMAEIKLMRNYGREASDLMVRHVALCVSHSRPVLQGSRLS